MKIKKHHMVLAALMLLLSASVYINWSISDNDTSQFKTEKKEFGAATYVNSDLSTFDEVDSTSNASSLNFAQTEYFAAAKIERQNTQEEMISLAREVLELSDSSESARESAANQLGDLENMVISQNRIEATLKAKGFSECLCYLDESSCTIIIPVNEMRDNSTLVIRDCVAQCSGLSFDSISIIEV